MLAGCSRSIIDMGTRAPWRQEAEEACLKAGTVRETADMVRIAPIEGPGVCGAEFPFKVAAFGEGPAISYADELRPPGSVSGGTRFPPSSQPAWPVSSSANRYGTPEQVLSGPPVSLEPPGVSADRYAPPSGGFGRSDSPRYDAPRGNGSGGDIRGGGLYDVPELRQDGAPSARRPRVEPASRDDDVPDDAQLPDAGSRARRADPAPAMPDREPPRLGPARGPLLASNIRTAVTPPATLACPMISTLDKWIMESVQPAARRWFRQSVVEIKQISAYSCRAMVGSASAHVSEHAYGNAIDIAAFILADGRKVTVKNGWDGAPEETGFLHDVQLAACDRFSTVLGPGYNVYHYDHIHLDLIRRASGHIACRPRAIPGEVAAARQMQKSKYANRGDRMITGSIGKSGPTRREAIPGQDGDIDEE